MGCVLWGCRKDSKDGRMAHGQGQGRDGMEWDGTDDGVVKEHVEFRWMATLPRENYASDYIPLH